MISSFSFQTRARTIDHLGREQIADCPTAVSELWKNAYDAYARNVGLHIYDGEPAIATIVDDGHGMSREDFCRRWLVVGTESKADSTEVPEEDRDGLAPRTRQGQKGIGRLSCANVGPLLLIVSKRRNHPFVASLIDWRLFENPYLFLTDVEVPVVEFDDKQELLPLLPDMFDKLMGNIWGGPTKDRSERDLRIQNAWKQFSDQEQAEGKSETTLSRIEATVIHTVFDERHFEEWPLWKGRKDRGTVLAISGIQFDLDAQFAKHDAGTDSAVRQARERLYQSLANFTDPFLSEDELRQGYGTTDFSTIVTVREGGLRRSIIEEGHPFDLEALLQNEHVVDGEVDESGVFRGRIKAFGSWVEENAIIRPPGDIPTRKDVLVGPFHIRLGTFEQKIDSTTHSEEIFRDLEAKTERYGGLSVYRNGLRVLPYGREGSDFFEIEKRRTKHAGREFWSLRRLFGRVALRMDRNPNLRDKAGREGLIDNRAAKIFRDLVENILRTTALDYFGTDSTLRKSIVSELKENYKQRKAEEERNKQRLSMRRRFGRNLETYGAVLADLLSEIELLADKVRGTDLKQEASIADFRSAWQGLKNRFQEISLGEAPRNLGSMEDRYRRFRENSRRSKELLDSLNESLVAALETIKPRSSKDLAYSALSANASFLHKRIRGWTSSAESLLRSEAERIASLRETRNKAYHALVFPLVDEVEQGRISLRDALQRMERERDLQDVQNADLFEPYLSALQSIKENIDLAGLVEFSQDQVEELRDEVDRLHGLAQLGITVEIISHEIEGLEQTVSAGLDDLPDSVKTLEAFSAVKHSHEALVDRLRFLSPLKLSGPKDRLNLTGEGILGYLRKFFRSSLDRQGIRLEASPAFLRFSVFEQPARIYPVFVNLVNNAAYWVSFSKQESKEILLDAVDGKVVVADNGPGVDEDDRKSLFRLFFTRKIRGGRGVGLYLCRANLAAGGHVIKYADEPVTHLPGANFVIEFSGAKYD